MRVRDPTEMAECLISNAAGRFYFISRRLFICGYKESLITTRMKKNHYHFGDTINYWLASTTDTPHCTTHEVCPACNWYNRGVNSTLIIGMSASAWKKSVIGNSFNPKVFTELFHCSWGGKRQRGTQRSHRLQRSVVSEKHFLRFLLQSHCGTSSMVATGLWLTFSTGPKTFIWMN